MKNIADLRENYNKGELLESQLNAENPFELFDIWWQQAVAVEHEPNAMVLSSIDFNADEQAIPHSRVVLLKGYDHDGFIFFTNYESHKSQQMQRCPQVCLNFHWHQLERQIRIEGVAEKISQQASEQYFFSRPKSSQIGAWSSEQSQIIDSREFLEQREQYFINQFQNVIPYPEHWGGWIIKPQRIEFWQGRPSRLHDRINYLKTKNSENNNLENASSWQMTRLAP